MNTIPRPRPARFLFAALTCVCVAAGCTATNEIPPAVHWAETCELVVANKTVERITDVGVAYYGFSIHRPIIHDDAIGGGGGWEWPRPVEVPETARVSWSSADGVRHEKDLPVAAPVGPVPPGHRGRIRLEIHRNERIEIQFQPPPPGREIAVTAYNASPLPVHHVRISPGADKGIYYESLPPARFAGGFPIGMSTPAELVTVQWLDNEGNRHVQSVPFAPVLPPRPRVIAILRFDPNGSLALVPVLPGERRAAVMRKLNRPRRPARR
jgi:hypothetical protein